MVKEKEVIGVDLGGTAIKFGRFLLDGTCLESFSIPTPQPATPEDVISAIALTVNKINPEKNTIALGIGVPGATDAGGRIAKVAINLSGWHDVPLAQELEAKTGLKTTICNDANCAGLGEAWLGAGKNYQNLILLTIGTGVGGAIILNGKLFVGHNGAAGELGLVTFNPHGHPCNSGNKGSFEQHASATAIYRDTGKKPSEWGELAKKNDPQALQFWQDYGKTLGTGLATYIYIFSPEAILIGGGVSASAEYFLPSAWQEVEKRVLPSSREGLKLMVAQLGNDAGMVGAAKLAWQLQEDKSS
ncbi:ROK family protein [Cyanobacterium stanieri LEGE 03274]|uniref:ROK family protein n=1 Tax=Cyanobacterium stanieri LEGE 03274 TaxID=1828756 RepID=A0ABR9V6B8_9CHRO|nr:ROK family protein [Cyanobacterium stanieri]MBE9223430.1 ROK family protein [Cyanobacterium stanieri LEGE 03274]